MKINPLLQVLFVMMLPLILTARAKPASASTFTGEVKA
jgi:hypothetical protein